MGWPGGIAWDCCWDGLEKGNLGLVGLVYLVFTIAKILSRLRQQLAGCWLLTSGLFAVMVNGYFVYMETLSSRVSLRHQREGQKFTC